VANNRIGLNLITLRDGEDADELLANLDRVRGAGFQSVGPWRSTLEQWVASGRSISHLAHEIAERGLKVDEICYVMALDEDGKVADRRRIFEWARELGAGAVISIYDSPANPPEKVRQDWAQFVATVEDIGVDAAFEFVGMWPQYNSPLEAYQVIRDLPPVATMVFDTFHFWRGGCDVSQIKKVPPERISLVHLNDVKDVRREGAVDADRTYPGEGIMPLPQIVGALLANGFAGPMSVEIFGEVQQQKPDKVAQRACKTARKVLEAL
jgi:2-keto-myo-inositol isomerase